MRLSFAIIRNTNHKIGNVPLAERHNERRNHNYSNKDIDVSRSHLNYSLKEPTGSYLDAFYDVRETAHLKGNLRLTGKKQSTILCEFIMTSDKDFFDRIGEERTRKFFEDAYHFACMKAGGEQYVISAVVHMDEKTPHMHLTFIPVVQGKDRKGNPCRRINCSKFWEGKYSYSKFQDEYFDWMTSHGYDLERGKKGSTAQHLSTEEYKLQKTQEQLAAAREQAEHIEQIDALTTVALPFGKTAISTSDLNALTTAAKGYVALKDSEQEIMSLKSKVSSLRNENETLKNNNADLSGKLQQLDYDFGVFYDSVSDEVALKNENAKLKTEIQNLGNQYHGVCESLKQVTNNNQHLTETVKEQAAEINTLSDKLTALQKLHKALEDKFARVMQFIENLHLKEKLDAFLHQKEQRMKR